MAPPVSPANVTPAVVEAVPEVEPGRISSPEYDEEESNRVEIGDATRAKAKAMQRTGMWRVTWL